MGSAAMAYTLWDRSLKYNPRDPHWPDRDRFILSAGHGCALLYALLHVTGFDLPLDELKRFRQWGSHTPGHPEFGKTPGVEATTGPLGQGLANGVGMAIAEVALAAHFNRPGHKIVDHYTYVLVSDGDLEEGISSEAGSVAGHQHLGKLIVLYADNHITIEGSTELTFTEDRMARFAAFGWHVQRVEQSNDVDAVALALANAREETDRPSLIAVRTHIGFGSPHKQDTAAAHGEALGVEEVRLTKEAMDWPASPPFHVPEEALEHFRRAVARGSVAQAEWEARFQTFAYENPDLAAEFLRVIDRQLPKGWDTDLPAFTPADGPMATRVASGKVIEILGSRLPEMMGGSADLGPRSAEPPIISGRRVPRISITFPEATRVAIDPSAGVNAGRSVSQPFGSCLSMTLKNSAARSGCSCAKVWNRNSHSACATLPRATAPRKCSSASSGMWKGGETGQSIDSLVSWTSSTPRASP
jgi:transketolase